MGSAGRGRLRSGKRSRKWGVRERSPCLESRDKGPRAARVVESCGTGRSPGRKKSRLKKT